MQAMPLAPGLRLRVYKAEVPARGAAWRRTVRAVSTGSARLMAYVSTSAISVDTRGLDATLEGFRKDQLPYAKKEAINALAKDTIRAEQVEMFDVFERPTPFVIRGLRVAKHAKKTDPTAAIWFKDVFGRFGEAVEDVLRPQIEGGGRNQKSTERRLRKAGVLRPNEWLIGVAVNAAGNVPGPEHQRVLSYFRAYHESGFTANRAAGAAGSRAGYRYHIQPAGSGRAIYRVRGKRGKPKMIFYITTDAPTYRTRFDFYGEAARHAAKFGGYFARRAMDKALRTAR